MKTWEMIKELTEHPNKSFKLKGEKNIVYSSDLDSEGKIELDQVDFITIYDQWEEEVKEPVTFIDVVRAAKEGNRVGLNFNRFGINCTKWELRDLMIDLGEDFEDEELAEIILNGKWYIED